MNSEQTALALVQLPDPDQAVELIIRDPVARNPDIIRALDALSDSQLQASKERIAIVKRFIIGIHELVDRFAKTTTLSQLANVARGNRVFWHPQFKQLIQAFIQDALDAGTPKLADELSNALHLKHEALSQLQTHWDPLREFPRRIASLAGWLERRQGS